MISLTLKSTIARALAIFSVITLCGTSFARIERKKQPEAAQTEQQAGTQQTEEQTADATATESSYVYPVVGTIMVFVFAACGYNYKTSKPNAAKLVEVVVDAVDAKDNQIDVQDGDNDANNDVADARGEVRVEADANANNAQAAAVLDPQGPAPLDPAAGQPNVGPAGQGIQQTNNVVTASSAPKSPRSPRMTEAQRLQKNAESFMKSPSKRRGQ